jgi:hypothetical protein
MQYVIFVIWCGRVGNQDMEFILDYKFVFIFYFSDFKKKLFCLQPIFQLQTTFLSWNNIF